MTFPYPSLRLTATLTSIAIPDASAAPQGYPVRAINGQPTEIAPSDAPWAPASESRLPAVLETRRLHD